MMLNSLKTVFLLSFVGILSASIVGCDLSVPEPEVPFDIEAQYIKDSILIEQYLTKYGIEDVQYTESGLRYKVLQEGEGPQPNANDVVSMHFTISLLDSAVVETTVREVANRYNIFDSAVAYIPYKFNMGGGFTFSGIPVQGLREGSRLMKLNDRYAFYIPSKLAFGNIAYGKIPANGVSVWELRMVQIR